MKRKQLSMKRLYIMAMDYINQKISDRKSYGLSDVEKVRKLSEDIKEFLDYVWKHKEEEL